MGVFFSNESFGGFPLMFNEQLMSREAGLSPDVTLQA
jgi:hypothetical protein